MPGIQQSVLRAFHAMCHSPSATTIKTKLAQCSALPELLSLCENHDPNVRANAVKLLCSLTDNSDEGAVLEHVDQKSTEKLLGIIGTSDDEEEIASAMGIISKLPEQTQITDWMLNAGTLQHVVRFIYADSRPNGSYENQLIENAVGVKCHFANPSNQLSQKIAAESGVITLLVQLLDFGSRLAKELAAHSLAGFSKSSTALSRPLPKHHGFLCFSPPPEPQCPVHKGICTVEESFCLVKAGAVGPLVRVLEVEGQHPGVSETTLDALLTLIGDERLPSGSKVLAEANAIPPIIKLLGVPSPRLQEKVLISLGRIFRQIEFKQKYGASAHMLLVDLTQRGNSSTKPLGSKILAHLNVLPGQSSFF